MLLCQIECYTPSTSYSCLLTVKTQILYGEGEGYRLRGVCEGGRCNLHLIWQSEILTCGYIYAGHNSSRYNSNHHHHCSLSFPYKAKRNCFNLWETLKEEVVDFIFIFLFHVCVARRSNAMKHLCNRQNVFYNICMVTYHTNIVTMTTNYNFHWHGQHSS